MVRLTEVVGMILCENPVIFMTELDILLLPEVLGNCHIKIHIYWFLNYDAMNFHQFHISWRQKNDLLEKLGMTSRCFLSVSDRLLTIIPGMTADYRFFFSSKLWMSDQNSVKDGSIKWKFHYDIRGELRHKIFRWFHNFRHH